MIRCIIVILVLGSLQGCYYNNEEDLLAGATCDTTAVTYINDVSVILESNCMPCHSSAVKEGGISLEGYANIKPHVEPGGRLLGAIKHEGGYSPMPKGASQLSSCDISKIEKWIAEGSQRN